MFNKEILNKKQESEIKIYRDLLEDMYNEKEISKQTLDIVTYHLKDYIQRGDSNRKKFNIVSIAVIIITASIPFINSIEDAKLKYIVSFLAVISNILASIMYLKNYKLSWIRYRTLAEKVKKEIRWFINNANKVNDEENIEFILMNNIQSVIDDDVDNWSTYLKKKDNEVINVADKNNSDDNG
ncbi:DUF4231 domain-containing protein [Oceanirhabdus sp. W0125-5]|uniref:DUF4231 domain-containing protein n=1 Tax=Oceanirhabdus sp. W0125-5 TaxID=2999116 RepID=UPI0022F2C473|nr:DUF4231 domain-containing protein [Oceanirhabdus sp. W0125-5]WBW99001.1 DUF4231 domain-containing protein [Oceanirhabdus sp. W0125-5]